MPLRIDHSVTTQKLRSRVERLFDVSAGKILSLEKAWNFEKGSPVFTIRGKYSSRGWTEWTQGFQFGSSLLQFDGTGEQRFLEMGRKSIFERMATHVSHVGVHDHGFNNISTYGNLWRLMREGRIPFNERENDFYELALKVSGAIQAARWTQIGGGKGYIYSFNGAHSLFIDTIRSLRSLALSHQLGHVLMGEQDQKISLLQRLIEHADTTARYAIYYGEGRDAYDVPGRTAHESIYAELLEFFGALRDREAGRPRRSAFGSGTETVFLRAATITAEFYVKNSCADGIPIWDTAAPNLHRLGDYLSKPADPFNRWEPMDSSAAVIAAQGLLRLGNYLVLQGEEKRGTRYRQAALTIANTVFEEPYLSTDWNHQGLLLHSVYHRPNGWDYIAARPHGEHRYIQSVRDTT